MKKRLFSVHSRSSYDSIKSVVEIKVNVLFGFVTISLLFCSSRSGVKCQDELNLYAVNFASNSTLSMPAIVNTWQNVITVRLSMCSLQYEDGLGFTNNVACTVGERGKDGWVLSWGLPRRSMGQQGAQRGHPFCLIWPFPMCGQFSWMKNVKSSLEV